MALLILGLGSDFDFVGYSLIQVIALREGRLDRKSVLLSYRNHLFAARFSETLPPPPPYLETFQSKIDHQFKMCALADVDDAYNQVYI